jgi:hypothetical protein
MGVDGKLIDNPTTELPTEKEVTDTLKQLQDDWDKDNT